MTSAASEDLRWVQKRAFPGPPGGREGFGKGFGKGHFWKGLGKWDLTAMIADLN